MKYVIIDVHEPRELDILLRECDNTINVVRKRLVPGDLFVNNVLIERKTLSDFAVSLQQKRLFEQLDRLRSVAYDCLMEPLVIIETPTEKFSSRMYLFLIKIQLDMSIPVIISSSLKSTAEIIACLTSRRATTPLPSDFYHPRQWTHQEQRIRMLMHIPGIGRKTALKLLSSVGSLKAIACFSRKELRNSGLGKVRSKRVEEIFRD